MLSLAGERMISFKQFLSKFSPAFDLRLGLWPLTDALLDDSRKRVLLEKDRQVGVTTMLSMFALYASVILDQEVLYLVPSNLHREEVNGKLTSIKLSYMNHKNYMKLLKCGPKIISGPGECYGRSADLLIIDELQAFNPRVLREAMPQVIANPDLRVIAIARYPMRASTVFDLHKEPEVLTRHTLDLI